MFQSFLQYLKRNKLTFLLIALACIIYFIVLANLGSFQFVRNSLYSTDDSLEYKDYAAWISGAISYCNPNRSFFYPLLIFLSDILPDHLGIWAMQFLFWLAGCILVFKTMIKISGRPVLAMISFALAVSNISLITYSAFALTEVTTFFFLSLLMYILVFASLDFKKPFIFLTLLVILSVLTTIKPLYQLPWYCAIAAIFLVNFQSIVRKPLLILLIILASSPVIIQKSINKINTGSYFSTKIADYNLRFYFYKKVKYYSETGNNPDYNSLADSTHEQMKSEVSPIEKSEIISFLTTHPVETFQVYWDNLHENLSSGNPYISRKTNLSLAKWSENSNHNIFYYVHLLMAMLWLYYTISRFKRRPHEYYFILFLGLINFFILFTSGITYWAGDRLVVSAQSLWSVLYPLLIFSFFIRKTEVNAAK